MARRTVWLVTGVVAGAASSLYAERKLRTTLEAAQARMQPDALVAGVGRSARQAATSTRGRVREALAAARAERVRREEELWAELGPAAEGARPVDASPDGTSPAGTPPAVVHGRIRRVRRVVRRSPTPLGN